MGLNYEAWKIRIEDFCKIKDEREKLKFLLSFAILAPSGHNSQPWEFIISGKKIDIFINRERSLGESDPFCRLLMMSFGCLIKNILIAIDYFKLNAVVSYFPSSSNSLNVARILFEKGNTINQDSDKNNLIFQVAKRHTNRGPYLSKSLPFGFLSTVQKLSNREVKALIISDGNLKDNIADLIIESTIEIMDDVKFRKELSQYIKSNFTRSKMGMPGFALGLSGFISLFASILIKNVNLSRKNRRQDEKLLKKETPAFFIISTYQDRREDWLNAGFFLQHIWLLAQSYGLSCSPFASITQISSFRKKLQDELHSTFFPQLVVRIGYPKKNMKPTPRFMVENLIRN